MANRILHVGVVGAGEAAQQLWLPTLSLLNQYYVVDYICDISKQAVEFCQARFHIPHGDTSADKMLESPSVDVIFILTSDEYHESYTVAALRAGKHVMVEKPISLSVASVERIIEAERASPNGARVFVGYMRRYAPSFVKAFKREVSTMPEILYARVRDFPGPNAAFVKQSGISALVPTDFPEPTSPLAMKRNSLIEAMVSEALSPGAVTEEASTYCRFLGSLGSHDLSLMREALGFPDSVTGVSAHYPFYSAILEYHDKNGNPYSVTYETGIDQVQRFDAHIAVYGLRKTVIIQYDTPYIKGLPIKVIVDEINEDGEATRREVLSSYEDAYTVEAKELYASIVHGKLIKTNAEDAIMDLKLFKMLLTQYERQQTRRSAVNGM